MRVSSVAFATVIFVSPAMAADMVLKAASTSTQSVTSPTWIATFASEARYYSWSGERGYPTTASTSAGSGSQVYTPFALQLAGQPNPDWKVSFLVRGGWVSAKQSTPGLTGWVDTMTDTVGLATFTYLGIRGVQPFVSVSANAPTGRSALFGTAAVARMDPDLVEIGSYGEGWNIGPTVGVNVPITSNLLFTTSAGYTWRGDYERERSGTESNPFAQSPTSISPGQVVTGTASIAYKGDTWSWSLAGSVSGQSATEENGIQTYKPGVRYLGTGSLSYRWPQQWGETTFSGSVSHSERNEVLWLGSPTLVKEWMNANSNLYRVGAQHLVALEKLTIGPTGSYLYRDSNSYDAITLQFVPEKQRWAAGGLVRYAASDKITLNARFEYIWIEESERLAPGGQQFSFLANAFVPAQTVPNVASRGYVIAGGLNAKF